jgi:hypothetical protein
MELPEDILAIVWAYSKPIFEHYQAYNYALKVLGKKKWSKLKEKLQEEPEVVLPALKYYVDAFIHKQNVYRRRDQMKKQLETAQDKCLSENQIHNMCFYAKRTEEDTFWLLIRILHGDGKEYWDVKEDISI